MATLNIPFTKVSISKLFASGLVNTSVSISCQKLESNILKYAADADTTHRDILYGIRLNSKTSVCITLNSKDSVIDTLQPLFYGNSASIAITMNFTPS